MTSDFTLGLQLSAIGLSVTFLALSLVIIVMELLVRIFPWRAAGEAMPGSGTIDLDEKQREETAVALAVGVAILDDQTSLETHDPTLGKLLEG